MNLGSLLCFIQFREAVGPRAVFTPTDGGFVLQHGGVFSILQLLLGWLLGIAIIFVAMLLGGVLVAGLSIPLVMIFPTVGHPLFTLAEMIGTTSPNSLRSWRFIRLYLLFIYAYGFSLVLSAPMLVESVGRYSWPVTQWQVDLFAVSIPVVAIGAAIILAVGYNSETRLRTILEWIVFLGIVDILILIASIVVYYLVIGALDILIL